MVYTAVNYGTGMGDCGDDGTESAGYGDGTESVGHIWWWHRCPWPLYHMVNGDDDTNGRHHDDEKSDDDNAVDVQSMQSDGTTKCLSCGKGWFWSSKTLL